MATRIRGECPHCGMEGQAKSELDRIFVARRVCERCGKMILIINGKPMKPEDYKSDSAA